MLVILSSSISAFRCAPRSQTADPTIPPPSSANVKRSAPCRYQTTDLVSPRRVSVPRWHRDGTFTSIDSPYFWPLRLHDLERTGQCELAKRGRPCFPTHNRNVLTAAYGNRQTDEIRGESRATRPGFDRLYHAKLPPQLSANGRRRTDFLQNVLLLLLSACDGADDHRRALAAAGDNPAACPTG